MGVSYSVYRVRPELIFGHMDGDGLPCCRRASLFRPGGCVGAVIEAVVDQVYTTPPRSAAATRSTARVSRSSGSRGGSNRTWERTTPPRT